MTANDNVPDYTDLEALLAQLGAMISAAELHGYAAGILAVDPSMAAEQWLAAAAQFGDLNSVPSGPDGESLLALYRVSHQQLTGGEMDFELLLPADDTTLARRAEALGQWCQGFLNGFALAGKAREGAGSERGAERVPERVPESVSEVIRDMAAIAQIDVPEADDESSEQDFFDLTEYLRLAAVNIYLELHPQQPKVEAPAKPVLH